MTSTYFLTRLLQSADGTFGSIIDPRGTPLCVTCELPWDDNEPDKSCIPAGTYLFTKYQSPEHGQVWMAQGIPNRSNIEIHAANWPDQLLGCIGVGEEIMPIEGKMGVSNSDVTLNQLRGELPDSFYLTITDQPQL